MTTKTKNTGHTPLMVLDSPIVAGIDDAIDRKIVEGIAKRPHSKGGFNIDDVVAEIVDELDPETICTLVEEAVAARIEDYRTEMTHNGQKLRVVAFLPRKPSDVSATAG